MNLNLAIGRLYAEAGNAEAAVNALRTASRLDVHEVEGLNLDRDGAPPTTSSR